MRRQHDFYETPPHYVKALCNRVEFDGSILEPCAGDNSIVNNLIIPESSIIVTNDWQESRLTNYHLNILHRKSWEQFGKFKWIVMNPPFSYVEEIIPLAWEFCVYGLATIIRLSFLEPCKGRAEWLAANQHFIKHLIVLPRYSFTGTGNDSVTCAWLVMIKDSFNNTVHFANER